MIPEYPSRAGQPLWRRVLGRTLDIVASLSFLLTLFPLIYVVVALFIKLRSSGPAIVLYPCPTEGGGEYEAYRFRLSCEDSLLARLPQALNLLRGEKRLWVDIRVVDSHPPVSAPSEDFHRLDDEQYLDEASTI